MSQARYMAVVWAAWEATCLPWGGGKRPARRASETLTVKARSCWTRTGQASERTSFQVGRGSRARDDPADWSIGGIQPGRSDRTLLVRGGDSPFGAGLDAEAITGAELSARL